MHLKPRSNCLDLRIHTVNNQDAKTDLTWDRKSFYFISIVSMTLLSDSMRSISLISSRIVFYF